MKVERKKLVAVTSNVRKAIAKSNNEMLESIKIEGKDGVLSLSSSSYYITITGSIDVDDLSDFTCVVNAAMFYNTISKVMAEYIELIKEEKYVYIKGQAFDAGTNYNIKLPILDDTLCPIETVEITDKRGYDGSILKNYIKACSHAIGNGDKDLKMGSFFIEVGDNDNLRVTSLDRYRISVRHNGNKEYNESFIVPGKQCKDAAEIIDEDFVFYRAEDNNIIMSGKTEDCHYNILIRLVEGSYFNFSSILNVINRKYKVIAKKQELLDALNVVTLFGHPILTITKDRISFSTKKESGMADLIIQAKTEMDIEKFVICLNGGYFKDAIVSLEGDDIEIDLTSENTPVLLSSNTKEAEIILPITIHA